MLARFFIDRPVFAWVLAIVIMLAGLFALRALPVSQYPDIAPPTVMVSASYPGASAQVVETSVIQVLEQELKGLDNLMYFSSTSSSSGQAEIMLTFRQGANPDTAQVQVQNKVSQMLARLPQQVQQNGLSVQKMQGDFLLIASFYDVSGQRGDTDIADWLASNVQDPLSRVDGVGSVRAFGAPYAMRIWLDPHKLNSYGLIPSDVSAAVSKQNTEVSVGELGARPSPAGQQLNAMVTAWSRLSTPEQFRSIVVKALPDGGAVRLGDVARVELGQEDYGSSSRLNGHPASGLAVMLAPGANALATAEAVKARVAELQRNFPPGIRVAYPEDTTHFVRLSIRAVMETLLEAVALVVLVMYVFLRNWRATLIPALTVPVVLLGTFGVLAAAGFGINTLTLFGMVLAIGLLVDDAIVVVENVERVMHEQGVDAHAATVRSMGEIGGALVGIGLVLGAVFLPMAFFGGSVGVIYRQFSITIVAAMALSVLTALTLTPALCATLLRPEKPSDSGPLAAFERRFLRLQSAYAERWLPAWLRRPLRGGLVYLALAAGLAALYSQLPTAFIPDEDQGTVMVQFTLPTGATHERADKVARAVEQHFLVTEKANVESVYMLSGFSFGGSGQNAGMAFVALKDWSLRQDARNSAQAIADRATAALASQRDAEVFGMVLPPIGGLGQTNGFEFWLQDASGMGREGLAKARDQLLKAAQGDDRLSAVRSGAADDKPQLRLDVDQSKAAALGLDLANVADTLGAAWGGRYINDFVDRGRVKKVMMQADAPYRSKPEDLGLWFVRGADGAMTPFSAFARARWEYGPAQLSRYNGLPALPLSGSAAAGISSGEAMRAVEAIAGKLPGTQYEWSGLSYQDRLSSGQTPLLYAVSILFVFLCLAALYESWLVPCAVMTAIPLGVLGAVLAVMARGLANDIYFQVGLLATIGLSAKNAILIIEFAEAAIRRGDDALNAALAAARQRLRPILMTSLAFGVGVAPLVWAGGPGAGSQNAIGAAVLGGVLSATVLTLFFVPLAHVLIRGLAGRVAARRVKLAEARP
ncbi:multidrug transporter [Chromobacterium violaceum]|uniref:efflux RND transporter permease subunit n=1 Tax=Chromobacterium violaceum TaxID=536 RepID=UPI000653E0D5|nr:efflux RND transporter permease subunit [Chromobacterium violaceum]KMN48988.1 multidrug transporter [Chromobacterium violaceum]KMN85167.1 multidrug transporter [Chromobacterium violaceum]KMN91737.1 multidrug transporter [Chromobacterium violaceum]KMO02905.1 multidrug transporter [Chromobacterium violaceum]